MKLQDISVAPKTKHVSKVMESYFGKTINFDKIAPAKAKSMLKQVQGLIAEQRKQSSFHYSEQDPSYLKLLMLEQGLTAAAEQTPQQAQAAKTLEIQNKRRELQDKIKEVDDQIKALQQDKTDLQKQLSQPMGESRRLQEASEVQQAQVVLASKDIVDQIQKMIETSTSIQFKDLPALVDQIRSEVGYNQATQFNNDATAALSGLVQNLQTAKGSMDQALGVVTGQASAPVPGEGEVGMAAPAMEPAVGADAGDDLDAMAASAEQEIEEPGSEVAMGRAKR